MKEISIFLASSSKLSKERDEIERLISRMNDKYVHEGVYLKLRIWEKMSTSFEKERKQDSFNSEVLKSDFFICLIYDKVGQFTKEEFDVAYSGLINSNRPKKMYVFFNIKKTKLTEISKDYTKVIELRELIQKYEQVYNSYENIDLLIRKVKDQIEIDLTDILKGSVLDELKEIINESNPNVSDFLLMNKQASILLTNDEYSRLKKIMDDLENQNIMRFSSNGNMIQNRPDGLMRTGWVAERLENYK